MSDLPSQYAEEIETFRHILDLPDCRETMPRSSTSVLALDDVKGQQELRLHIARPNQLGVSLSVYGAKTDCAQTDCPV